MRKPDDDTLEVLMGVAIIFATVAGATVTFTFAGVLIAWAWQGFPGLR